MSEPDGQQAPPPAAQPASNAAPSSSADPISTAPDPSAPLFPQPRMEAITASDKPPNAKTSDRPDR
jgi:hypothetical protein